MSAVLFLHGAVSEVGNTTQWDGHTQGLARGLEKIAIHKDDYAYYPEGIGETFCLPRSGWGKTAGCSAQV